MAIVRNLAQFNFRYIRIFVIEIQYLDFKRAVISKIHNKSNFNRPFFDYGRSMMAQISVGSILETILFRSLKPISRISAYYSNLMNYTIGYP